MSGILMKTRASRAVSSSSFIVTLIGVRLRWNSLAVIKSPPRKGYPFRATHGFPDAPLHSGSTIVEVPHTGRCHRQVRVPGSVGVMLHDKQGRLGSFSWMGLLTILEQREVTNRG